ncbi:MAG: hypothetical protein HYS07_11085, partial [Chlamydiae bacterium]|nr:hypothetical protein [Chlamydiota bacterium]MBI3276602.1 hypothetical protein [Chlamydiota bacterium]
WLFKDALLHPTPFFKDPYQLNLPVYGMQNHFNTQYIPLSFFFSLFAILFGDIAGYNLLILATFPLSGLGLFYLARHLTRSGGAALLGATIYALYPYRVAHLFGGQPGGFMHFLIPYVIYFYILGIQRKSWGWGLASGLCFLGLGLDELHVAYYMPLFLGIFLILPLFQIQWKRSSSWKDPQSKKTIFRSRKMFPYAIGVSFLGGLFGLFLSLWCLRRIEALWVWAFVPLGIFWMISFWFIYSGIYSRMSHQDFSSALKEDALTYLPFILLPLYLIQFDIEIPGFASKLFPLCLGGIFAMKIYYLLKWRRIIFQKFAIWVIRDRIKVFFAFSIPAIILISWLFFEKYSKLNQSVVAEGRALSVIKGYSPHFRDIWQRFNENGEFFIYPGLWTIILGLIGILIYFPFLRVKGSRRDRAVFGVLGVLFLLTYGLSLGPTLPLYNLFYANVPHLSYVRVPTRILYLSFFFLALLSSFGLKVLFKMIGRNSKWITASCLLAVGLDYLPSHGPGISLMPKTQPIYEYIQQHLQGRRILELPIWPGESSWSSIYQYYATRYRLPMLNGYRPAISLAYIEHVFKPLSPMNVGEMNRDIWKLLKNWNVGFVVVHEEAFPRKVSPFPPHFTTMRLKESGCLKWVRSQGGMYLFEVLDQPNFEKIQTRTNPILSILEVKDLKRLLGKEVLMEEASQGSSLYVDPSKGKGEWIFGRSKAFPQGSYQAFFSIKTDVTGFHERLLDLQIWDKSRDILLVTRPISSKDFSGEKTFKDFTLDFKLPCYSEIEPRIFYHGMGNVWVDRIAMGFQALEGSKEIFEAEELFHQGEIVSDETASGQEAVRVDKDGFERDLMNGLNPYYSKGSYEAIFWLKLPLSREAKLHEGVATLLIRSDHEKIISKKWIAVRQFNTSWRYEPFKLNFNVDHDGPLEFVIKFEGNTELWVDNIEVVKK